MNTLSISSRALLLLTCFASQVFLLNTSTTNWKDVRNIYAFDRKTKWDCFYRTTTPVKDMDPAIWRQDQYGNLLMAGLNFNCKGCICYTFDHRYPISNIGVTKVPESIVDFMSSIHNCQALAFRTNALKGSNEDHEIQSVINRFGCDQKTMRLFTDKNYMGARAVQKYLLSKQRVKQIHEHYINYVNGPNFLDPKDVDLSKDMYFKRLNKNADVVANKVSLHLASTPTTI